MIQRVADQIIKTSAETNIDAVGCSCREQFAHTPASSPNGH